MVVAALRELDAEDRLAGLGLDIARRIIVDRHHGQIAVDSQPGETTFRIQLPERRNSHQ